MSAWIIFFLHRVIEAHEVRGDQAERRRCLWVCLPAPSVLVVMVADDDHVVLGGDRQRFGVFALDVHVAAVVFGGVVASLSRGCICKGQPALVYHGDDAVGGEGPLFPVVSFVVTFIVFGLPFRSSMIVLPVNLSSGCFEQFGVGFRRRQRRAPFCVGAEDVRFRFCSFGRLRSSPRSFRFRRCGLRGRTSAWFRSAQIVGGVVRVHRAVDFVFGGELDVPQLLRVSSAFCFPFFVVVFAFGSLPVVPCCRVEPLVVASSTRS